CRWWHRHRHTCVVCLSVRFSLCESFSVVASPSGIFELQIGTFRSPRGELLSGECCDGERDKGGRACAEQCDTFFSVCVRQYQAASTPGRPTPCVLGNASTPVIGGNNFDLNSLSGPNIGRVSIPFRFAWP
uniref:Notch ligand N-terminal domain-containing protein n=1 Tax=Petromyzon marinus TaxID=7757 RepID=S4RTB2_PETMA